MGEIGLDDIAIEIPIGRIAALRRSEPGAPKVLALHGWLDNAASFIPLSAQLPGLDLVAIDLPGHGRSAHLPPGADYSFVGAINAILDVADALGWGKRRCGCWWSAACARSRAATNGAAIRA